MTPGRLVKMQTKPICGHFIGFGSNLIRGKPSSCQTLQMVYWSLLIAKPSCPGRCTDAATVWNLPSKGLPWWNSGNSLPSRHHTVTFTVKQRLFLNTERCRVGAQATNGTENEHSPKRCMNHFKIGKLQVRKKKKKPCGDSPWIVGVRMETWHASLRHESWHLGCCYYDLISGPVLFFFMISIIRTRMMECVSIVRTRMVECVGAENSTSAFLWSYFVVNVWVNGHSSWEIAEPGFRHRLTISLLQGLKVLKGGQYILALLKTHLSLNESERGHLRTNSR